MSRTLLNHLLEKLVLGLVPVPGSIPGAGTLPPIQYPRERGCNWSTIGSCSRLIEEISPQSDFPLRSSERLSFALRRATFPCTPQSDFPVRSAERLSLALRRATCPCAPQSDFPCSLSKFKLSWWCSVHPILASLINLEKNSRTSFEQPRYP